MGKYSLHNDYFELPEHMYNMFSLTETALSVTSTSTTNSQPYSDFCTTCKLLLLFSEMSNPLLFSTYTTCLTDFCLATWWFRSRGKESFPTCCWAAPPSSSPILCSWRWTRETPSPGSRAWLLACLTCPLLHLHARPHLHGRPLADPVEPRAALQELLHLFTHGDWPRSWSTSWWTTSALSAWTGTPTSWLGWASFIVPTTVECWSFTESGSPEFWVIVRRV